MTALITPFDHEGDVDFDALEKLVERQIEGGIHGLVPCGTTGESATMSQKEQLAVIETVARVADGRVPVIAGTGTNDTKKSVEFTQRVSKINGVNAALVVVPYYNKPGQRALISHFEAVAQYGGLPIVLYNIPSRSVVSMTPETIAELAEQPNVVGIKEATGDMVFDSRIRELAPTLPILSGDDFSTMPCLAIGGVGCISVVSNLIPGVMARMVEEMEKGNVSGARAIHIRIQKMARVLFSDSNPGPTKVAASLLGWCGATVRGPLIEASEETVALVEEMLIDYGLKA